MNEACRARSLASRARREPWRRLRPQRVSRSHRIRDFPRASRWPPWAASDAANCFRTPTSTCCSLVESENQISADARALSAFLQTLWDSGLRPSHAVHTVADCVAEHEDNAELTISLLDRRFLAGDRGHVQVAGRAVRGVRRQARRSASPRSWRVLREARRAKFQNTIYHLEPNIKDAPGGLRDLQTVRWLATLHRAR